MSKMKNNIDLKSISILLVDDDQLMLELMSSSLADIQCTTHCANSGPEALSILQKEQIDILLTDMVMPDMKGDELCTIVANRYPEVVRIMLTASPEISTILSAVNQGHIWGYLEKPWNNNQLIVLIEQAIRFQNDLAEQRLIRFKINRLRTIKKTHFQNFVGASVPMQYVYKSIENSASCMASVFITGGSGTGKELVAQAVHDLSARKAESFVVINCAAIPKELMESEIFGHIKGAFTGAISNREGAAATANGGTLFFDELGEMDLMLQAKLLRFIQTGAYQKVGSDRTEKSDIRFICATNRDPKIAIANGQLRSDLFYRLNVVSIQMPNLNQRGTDILLLAHFFLETIAKAENKHFLGFTSDAEDLLLDYSWPGNVRQLSNCIHNCVVLSGGLLLTRSAIERALQLSATHIKNDHLSIPGRRTQEIQLPDTLAEIRPLAEVEREAILTAVEIHGGRLADAAEALGLSPSTLYRKYALWNPEKA